jgi:WD40 repeat protein
LNACRWDLRGWEHDFLYTLFTKNRKTLHGHTNALTSVVFSPDGKRVASGSVDRTVKVWIPRAARRCSRSRDTPPRS